jgi:Ca-activated chloride channel family protein
MLLVRVQARRRARVVQQLGDPAVLQHRPGRYPLLHRSWVRLILVLVPYVSIVLALADPRLPYGRQRLRAGALDAVMVVDVSKSMAAEDYQQQTRLAKAQEMMRQLLPAFAGNRVGLVTFAGSSFRQAELTQDLTALDFIVQHWVNIDTAGVGGSDLVQAITTGLALFPDDAQRQKVMLLFSDGGEGDEHVAEVLTQAVQRHIKIVTFGLGSLQPSRIPQYDAQRKFKGFLQVDGHVATTQLLEAPLQHIAAATAGVYHRVTPGASWSHLLTQHSVVGDTLTRNERAIFQPLLLLGLLACGAQALIARL